MTTPITIYDESGVQRLRGSSSGGGGSQPFDGVNERVTADDLVWDALNGVALAPLTDLAEGDLIVGLGVTPVVVGLGTFYGYFVAVAGATYDDLGGPLTDFAGVDLDTLPDYATGYGPFAAPTDLIFPNQPVLSGVPNGFTIGGASVLYFATATEPVAGGEAHAVAFIKRAA